MSIKKERRQMRLIGKGTITNEENVPVIISPQADIPDIDEPTGDAETTCNAILASLRAAGILIVEEE